MKELFISKRWRFQNDAKWIGNAGTFVRVRFPGWENHEEGPDFLNALIEVDGRLVQGDVEIDCRQRDWKAHGHHDNPRFNHVVLHVVGSEEGRLTPVHTLNGHAVPTVALAQEEPGTRSKSELGQVGMRVLVRGGWKRFNAKVARMRRWAGRWGLEEALYRGILDAYGYGKFRTPFRRLADLVPLRTVKRWRDPKVLESVYRQAAASLGWKGAHVRPANRPDRRWRELAVSMTAVEGRIAQAIHRGLNGPHPRRALVHLGARTQGLGERMAVNAVLPWMVVASKILKRPLWADLARLWYREWPALESNAVTRRVGRRIFGRASVRLTALTQQGLHWIDKHPEVLLSSR